MTFVLHRAERADVLVDVLAELLAAPSADPFTPEVVAVHSRGVERWLSHRLASRLGAAPGRADGVCANLRFPFPGRLVYEALATATGVDAATDRWRPERLAWPLLDVVEANLDEPWMHVLAGHLGGTDVADARRDRRFAAVRHLADLFDRYGVHRPAMVRAWAAGDPHDGDGHPLPDDAWWQAHLWMRLRHAVGEPSPAERLEVGCTALSADPGLADLPGRFSLFGLTRLPASYLDVLSALALHRDVHLLALHPSPAAWAAGGDEVRHPLLRAWGRDSLEMQTVLTGRLEGAEPARLEHHPLAVGAPRTLLERLQQAVRDDTPPPASVDDRPVLEADDRSVQVHACHGRARQAEVVRDAVTHLLADDPTLEPRDIVLLCPDIDEMALLLRAAFEDDAESTRAIPFRLADRSLRQTNPVLGAVAELLALVDARLTVSQVLAFAAREPVRRRFGFDDADIDRMTGWVDSTGIRWGLDAAHRAPYGLAAVAAGTWSAGLDRLLTGVAMSEDGLYLVGDVLPLDDVDSGDIDLAGRFAEMVGRLGDVVRSLADPRPIADWAAGIDAAADMLVATSLDDGWQRGQLDRLLNDVVDEAGVGDGAPVRLAEVRDLVADRLRGQPSRAAFRTGDMTMCTLVPMRSVPHRVICLVGLDDGAFPRGSAPDGDDLLGGDQRRPGDHDRRAEDRQLLLDAVLAAGDTLVVTYAGRDPRTNEVLPPAVPVNELLAVVDATVRTADGTPCRDRIVRHHPLQPSDRRCFDPDGVGDGRPWSFDPVLLKGAVAATGPRRAPSSFLGTPLVPVDATVVALDDLVAFVQHPVRGFLRQRLGLSLRGPAVGPNDALAIELDGLATWGVGQRLLSALLEGVDPDVVCAAEIARGLLPPGELGRRALRSGRDTAVAIATKARAIADGAGAPLEVDVALPDGCRLVGTVPDVFDDVVRAVTYSSLGPKPRLGAWVRHLAVSAALPDRSLCSMTVGRQSRDAAVFGLPVLADTAEDRRRRAVELLADVVALYRDGLCQPLRLYCATSHAFALASRQGHEGPADEAAKKKWTSEYRFAQEDLDPNHLLVLDGRRTYEEIAADGRFGRLATRLWAPVLDEAQRWSAS
ncbi:MAG: exodeoxyribonuclease V subunit gamma [Acidimicrobiia bacterium]